MEQEKQRSLLARLYCVRSGLSIISDECSELKSEDDRIRGVNREIEDNTAEIINYNSIINTSKKTYKNAKSEYAKAKRKYDKKSFSFTVHIIIVVLLLATAIYMRYERNPHWQLVAIYDCLNVLVVLMALPSLVKALIINRKLKPERRKMRNAKQLMLDSKTWISESEKGSKLFANENRELSERKRELSFSATDSKGVTLPIAEAMFSALRKYCTELGASYFASVDIITELIKTGEAKGLEDSKLAVDAIKSSGLFEAKAYDAYEAIKSSALSDAEELVAEIMPELQRLCDLYLLEIGARPKRESFALSGTSSEIREEFNTAVTTEKLLNSFETNIMFSAYELMQNLDYMFERNV